MKVVIAGGSGYVGRALAASLRTDAHEVVVLSRRADADASGLPAGVRVTSWDARTVEPRWVKEIQGASTVVNLAGASIGARRWTLSYRNEIFTSRVAATHAIAEAIGGLAEQERPRVLVSASGVDYYGDQGDERVTEKGAPGESFLAQVCVQWEAAARRAEALGVRVVLARTALVVGRGAPALQKLALPFRLFAGGPLGGGGQWLPWVHLDDAVGLYRLAIERGEVAGPLVLASPTACRQREFAREVGRALGRPCRLPAPGFALRLALGRQADLLLHGRRAEPAKAVGLGYRFRYPELGAALREALGRR
ncbi:MAG: TIGR01777 family protein [Dehalococcoidia bacterium]|nr:TIGR01777 family protein [Dehalococcoidia bacterium]